MHACMHNSIRLKSVIKILANVRAMFSSSTMRDVLQWHMRQEGNAAPVLDWILITILLEWICWLPVVLRANLSFIHILWFGSECIWFVLNGSIDILRTHLVSILRGDSYGFCNWQGIKCSTWVSISRPTTLRSFFDPLGRQDLPSVAEGNTMVSRSALVICLVLALYGTFVVEQPATSILWRHPRMQWICSITAVRVLIANHVYLYMHVWLFQHISL